MILCRRIANTPRIQSVPNSFLNKIFIPYDQSQIFVLFDNVSQEIYY